MTITAVPPGWAGLCLKGTGANGAVPERLPSGHRGCDSGSGGGYWRLERRLGLVLRYGNAFGADSRPEVFGGPPPPSSDSLGLGKWNLQCRMGAGGVN